MKSDVGEVVRPRVRSDLPSSWSRLGDGWSAQHVGEWARGSPQPTPDSRP